MPGVVWGSSDALLIIIRSPAAADGTPRWSVMPWKFPFSQTDTCIKAPGIPQRPRTYTYTTSGVVSNTAHEGEKHRMFHTAFISIVSTSLSRVNTLDMNPVSQTTFKADLPAKSNSFGLVCYLLFWLEKEETDRFELSLNLCKVCHLLVGLRSGTERSSIFSN